METTLRELLVGVCEHILQLNHLVTTYSSNFILYKNKAMPQSVLLLDDNRDKWSLCNTPSGERLQGDADNVTILCRQSWSNEHLCLHCVFRILYSNTQTKGQSESMMTS